MRYARIRRNSEGIITIGEYLQETQPGAFAAMDWAMAIAAIMANTGAIVIPRITTNVIIFPTPAPNRKFDCIMREPPKPGRGGLVRGERL